MHYEDYGCVYCLQAFLILVILKQKMSTIMKHTFSILLFFCTSIFSAYGYHRAEIRFNTANNRFNPDSFTKRDRHYNTAEYSNESVHVGVRIGTSSHHDYYHEPRPAVVAPATIVKVAENAPAEYWFVVGDTRKQLSEEEFKAFTASPTAHNSVVVENSVTYNTADLIEISNECIADMANVEYENHTDFFASVTDTVQQTLNLDVSSERPHELPQETREFLRHHEYDTALLEKPLKGTPLQHVLHDQCLSIFDNVALRNPIAMVPTLAPLYSALLDFGWAAITCNVVGEVKSAFHIIKLCLPLLDQTAIMSHARYVGTTTRDVACRSYCGLGKGVDNFIAILRDPKTFLHSCCKTINAGGQGLLRMTAQCAKLDMLVDMAIQDPVKATVQLETMQKEIEPIVRQVQVQFEQLAKMSAGDIAEQVTTSVVEGLLFSGLVKLCAFTVNTIPVLIETIRDGVAFGEIAMTAEGIPVRVPAKALEYTQDIGHKAHKLSISSKIEKIVEKVPEFIKDKRVPLDKETILHHTSFEKTKIPTVKGAQVYKNGDKFYHRDTFHKGKGAHLEVYNKKGKHLGEADPITGYLIENTADKTKKLIF